MLHLRLMSFWINLEFIGDCLAKHTDNLSLIIMYDKTLKISPFFISVCEYVIFCGI